MSNFRTLYKEIALSDNILKRHSDEYLIGKQLILLIKINCFPILVSIIKINHYLVFDTLILRYKGPRAL